MNLRQVFSTVAVRCAILKGGLLLVGAMLHPQISGEDGLKAVR